VSAAHERTNNASGYAIFQNRGHCDSFLRGLLYLYTLHISEGKRIVSTVSLMVVLSVNRADCDHSGPDPDSYCGIG